MTESAPSSVQKEHGHSPIAHPILEALCAAPLSAAQYKIVLHVIRMTYGWSRKEAPISNRDFVAATGLPDRSVRRVLAELVTEGVLVQVKAATFRESAVYRLQKHAVRWGRYCPERTPVTGPDASAQTGADTSVRTPPDTSVRSDGSQVSEIATTSRALKQSVKQEKAKRGRAGGSKPGKVPIPDDWQPNDTHRRIATKEGVDVDREAIKFRNHAIANDRRQIDWNASFVTWLYRAAEYGARVTRSPPRKQGEMTDDEWLAKLQSELH